MDIIQQLQQIKQAVMHMTNDKRLRRVPFPIRQKSATRIFRALKIAIKEFKRLEKEVAKYEAESL